MIPMNYFSSYTLERFLARVRTEWDVRSAEVPKRRRLESEAVGYTNGIGSARTLTFVRQASAIQDASFASYQTAAARLPDMSD